MILFFFSVLIIFPYAIFNTAHLQNGCPDKTEYACLTKIGYYGLICATVFGLLVPVISVQFVPL